MISRKELEYFNGDRPAAQLWRDECRQDATETPRGTIRRLADAFSRVEGMYRGGMSRGEIVEALDGLNLIVPNVTAIRGVGSDELPCLSGRIVVRVRERDLIDPDAFVGRIVEIARGGVSPWVDLSDVPPGGFPIGESGEYSVGLAEYVNRIATRIETVGRIPGMVKPTLIADAFHMETEDFIQTWGRHAGVCDAYVKVRDGYMSMLLPKEKSIIYSFPNGQEFNPADSVRGQRRKLVEDGDGIFVDDPSDAGMKIYLRRMDLQQQWRGILDTFARVGRGGILFWNRVDGIYPVDHAGKQPNGWVNPCRYEGDSGYDGLAIHVNIAGMVRDGEPDLKGLEWSARAATNLAHSLAELEAETAESTMERFYKVGWSKDYGMRVHADTYRRRLERISVMVGMQGFGDMLERLSIPYDSSRAAKLASSITNNFQDAVAVQMERLREAREHQTYRVFSIMSPSREVATLMGTTPGFAPRDGKVSTMHQLAMQRIAYRHARHGICDVTFPSGGMGVEALHDLFEEAYFDMVDGVMVHGDGSPMAGRGEEKGGVRMERKIGRSNGRANGLD